MKQEQMQVLNHTQIAKDIYEITLQGMLVHEMSQPGQFVHIKVDAFNDLLLRRPISVCSINKENNCFTMLYRVDGAGTKRLSEKRIGDQIDILGPLGNGFPVEAVSPGQTALLVGGGIGVPPLYELSKRLKAKGVHVVHVLGFQSQAFVFYEEEFAKLGTTYVTTVDGSHGMKGFVTDKLQHLTGAHIIYACGPKPMLRALESFADDIPVYISLEERMGCGIGACFACVCSVPHSDTDYKKVCSDGPVFLAGEVVV
ncbi:dihydroorotate dehydrogenase electron transfer subunit [Bacillus sp. HMF5848]|uniref:dihydroorotate dehydrogenase electron transfer subunit n=1 Tax=Bacillus sp. HMF5848 TaxID=2495421 RepID=UPI0028A06485|nr:dihydroorotate dehydrogenase electron transfer subunit [Bacillus sp. HMF5848]